MVPRGHHGSAIVASGEPAGSLGTVSLITEPVAASRGFHGLLSAQDWWLGSGESQSSQ